MINLQQQFCTVSLGQGLKTVRMSQNCWVGKLTGFWPQLPHPRELAPLAI
jgi:hypothetical protein